MDKKLSFNDIELGKIEFTYEAHAIHPVWEKKNNWLMRGYFFENAKIEDYRITTGNGLVVFLYFDKPVNEAIKRLFKVRFNDPTIIFHLYDRDNNEHVLILECMQEKS